MKDLSMICVGYSKEDGSFYYEYKHDIKWTNLEISDNLYQSNVIRHIYNEDGTINESYYIKLTTKELIYNELAEYLISIYYQKQNNIEYRKEKDKLLELEKLKLYFDKYIDKNKIANSIITSKLIEKENIPDSSIILKTYEEIAYEIKIQINRIKMKSDNSRNKMLNELGYNNEKVTLSQLKNKTYKNIIRLLKEDYEEQKENFRQREEEIKIKIKEYDDMFKDSSQYKNELQILIRNKKQKNLNNFREKAKNFLFENGIKINDKH